MDPPAEISKSAFGRAVASRRAELHLTQEALSLRSGQHQKWISNVETARINPSLSNLARLAASLELRLSELIANAEAIDAQGYSLTAPGPRQRQLAARAASATLGSD